MGKASTRKRARREGCIALGATIKGNRMFGHMFDPSPAGPTALIAMGNAVVPIHDAVFSALLVDSPETIQAYDAALNAMGTSVIELRFAGGGVHGTVFGLALAAKAENCLHLLTTLAGLRGDIDILEDHFRCMLQSTELFDGGTALFVREHLKWHVRRSRQRGGPHLANLFSDAATWGLGRQANAIMSEVEAEELADHEREQLLAISAPAATGGVSCSLSL